MYKLFATILLTSMSILWACDTLSSDTPDSKQNTETKQEPAQSSSYTKNNCTFNELKNNKDLYADYDSTVHLDHHLISLLKDNKNKLMFMLFVGTWCRDSKNIVPIFFRYLQEAQWDTEHHLFIRCVDKTKKITNDNITEVLYITHVPTIIILKDGKEISRIIEYGQNIFPDKTISFRLWETVLIKILSHKTSPKRKNA